MNESEVKAAIASQEEYLKRERSCSGVLGKSHSWRRYGNPATRKPYEACVVCDVTRTADDYAVKIEQP